MKRICHLAQIREIIDWSIDITWLCADQGKKNTEMFDTTFNKLQNLMLRLKEETSGKSIRDRAIIALVMENLRRDTITKMTFPFDPRIIKKLSEETKAYLNDWMLIRGKKDGPLFFNMDRAKKGGPLSNRSINRNIFHYWCKKFEIDVDLDEVFKMSRIKRLRQGNSFLHENT
jgi:hypothetical protein